MHVVGNLHWNREVLRSCAAWVWGVAAFETVVIQKYGFTFLSTGLQFVPLSLHFVPSPPQRGMEPFAFLKHVEIE
jgi:hypothetical protein